MLAGKDARSHDRRSAAPEKALKSGAIPTAIRAAKPSITEKLSGTTAIERTTTAQTAIIVTPRGVISQDEDAFTKGPIANAGALWSSRQPTSRVVRRSRHSSLAGTILQRHSGGGFGRFFGWDQSSAVASARLLPLTSCAKVAAMNRSRSPSSTPWVSDVSKLVRRSLTI